MMPPRTYPGQKSNYAYFLDYLFVQWFHCKEEREETNHLFAYCGGLAHARMRVMGKAMLEENFDWQPHQLLSMINIIDKLYPEEGESGSIPTREGNGQDDRMDIGLTNAHED
jgi:hypothetical protein